MTHIHHIPKHPQLINIISSMWFIQDSHPQTANFEKVTPHGGMVLVFELDALCQYINPKGNIETVANIALTGHSTNPIYWRPTGTVKSFGINFSPCVPIQFIGHPAHLFTNQVISCNDANLPMYNPLLEQLQLAISPAQMFLLAEKFFLDLIVKSDNSKNMLSILTSKIIQKKGNISVSDVFLTYTRSKRRLEQEFLEKVGISAGSFIKKVRFLHFFKTIEQNPSQSLTILALDSGYYDQAHFIRDFKFFAGTTPSNYLKKIPHYDQVFIPSSPLFA